LRDARFVTSGSITGQLYDLGEYPGVVREPHTRRRVFGELYEIPDDGAPAALRRLDEYEGSEFTRERAYVTSADGKRRLAWTYVLRKRPGKFARHVSTGRYDHRKGAA
jgi:gamma-glutamylcyclotransferase (GGCT)/AIG2-like uncharacterized protein YtfP